MFLISIVYSFGFVLGSRYGRAYGPNNVLFIIVYCLLKNLNTHKKGDKKAANIESVCGQIKKS